MKRLLPFLLLLIPAAFFAQNQSFPGGGSIAITTVSGLNSVSGKTKGTIAVVTDGNSATDCTTGGGSTVVSCQYSGTTWAQMPASGVPAGSNTQVQYNNNGAFGADVGFVWSGSLLTLKPASGSCPIAAQNSGGTPQFSGITSGGFCDYTFGDNLTVTNALSSALYKSASNCSSSASPAVCGSAASGSVVVAAAATTVQVNTTAVTANSQIQLTRDDSLGTKLSVTCNTATVVGTIRVSARTGGSNFTIAVDTTPATNPVCISYSIIN